jgi:hypothetical protein
MLFRSRMLVVFLGFSSMLVLGACDDEDDADATDETDGEVDGGW